jgi:uncharacterized protein YndB with AHSA1/START domain
VIGHPEFQRSAAPSTLVEFTLEEVAGGTQLKLVESGFASLPEAFQEQPYREYEGGWKASLGRLRTYLPSSGESFIAQKQ